MSKQAGPYPRVPSVKHNPERMEPVERTDVTHPAAGDVVGGTVRMRNAQCDLPCPIHILWIQHCFFLTSCYLEKPS